MSRAVAMGIVLCVVLAGAAVALPAPEPEIETYVPHPPIRIVGDEGPEGVVLAWQDGAPVYRPGSGVVGGTGSADDPFVIAGWRPQGALTVVPEAISIEGTRSHIRIEGNLLSSSEYGIRLRDVENVVVVGNEIRGNAIAGIWIEESDGIVVDSNVIATTRYSFMHLEGAGLMALRSDATRVLENTFVANEFIGLRLVDAHDTLVQGNVFERNGGSLRIESAHGTTITANVFTNTASNTENHVYLVREWTAAGPLPDPSGNVVARNTFANANTAVRVRESSSLLVEENDISSVKIGLSNGAPGTVFASNNLRAWIGIVAYGAPVDARGNWWGCDAGPGAPGCSPIETSGGASVSYDPWLTSPYPGAGLATGADTADAGEGQPARQPHPPIVIEGDVGPTGFILARDPVTGAPIYRPGSGVVAGSGFPWDPYVIRGWDILPGAGAIDAAIHLVATSAYVIIEDVRAHDTPYGVSLHGARNVVVRDNDLVDVWRGVAMTGASRVSVLENRIDTPDPYTAFMGTYGVAALESSDIVVDGNTIRHAMTGVVVRESARVSVTNNDMAYDHALGLAGIHAFGSSSDLLLANNLISAYLWGIELDSVQRALVEANELVDISFTSFEVAAGQGVLADITIRGNNIAHAFPVAHRGVFNDAQTAPVDMRGNWWGCADGPSSGSCAPVVDEMGVVDATAWLTAPNPSAGPQGGAA